MAIYEATFRIVDTSIGATFKTERFSFNAKELTDAINFTKKHQRNRNGYFQKHGGRYIVKLSNLKVFGAGHIDNPRYAPAADICDDCGRPFWKGHNLRVEH